MIDHEPQISIVSLSWNSAEHLRRMLPSVAREAASSGIDVDMFLIDNGSTDDSLAVATAFRREHPFFHLVPLGRNHGTTMSRNIGVRMSSGQYVLFLDSDTVLPAGTLRGLLDACARIPAPERLGILHPRLRYPNGAFQESARRFPTMLTKVFRTLGLESFRRRDETIPEVFAASMVTVDYAISAAWLVPRTVFDRIGLLDERIFYSPEDLEFCARCWRGGLEVWYCPDVTIVHDCQRLTARKPLSALGLSHLKGLVYYWMRYGSFLRRTFDIPRRSLPPHSAQ